MLISSKRTLYLAPCVWWDVTQTLREPLVITGTRMCIDETRRHYWQPCSNIKSLKPQTCSYHVESVLNDVSKQTGHLSLVSHKSDEFDSSEFINVREADYRCRSAQVVIDLLPLTVWRCINSIFCLSPFNRPFSRWTWVSWCLLKRRNDGSGGYDGSYKSCKAPVKSSLPTNQHLTFYRPNALPVAHPAVSNHWRENQSTEGKLYKVDYYIIISELILPLLLLHSVPASQCQLSMLV